MMMLHEPSIPNYDDEERFQMHMCFTRSPQKQNVSAKFCKVISAISQAKAAAVLHALCSAKV